MSDRRSTLGYVLKLHGSTVGWETMKQRTVALSTAEAEYYALTEAIIWVRSVLLDFAVELGRAVTIHGNNQSAIPLAKNPGHHRSSKYIDLRYHFIREQVAGGIVSSEYRETSRQTADIFTKRPRRPSRRRFDLRWVDSRTQVKQHPIASKEPSIASSTSHSRQQGSRFGVPHSAQPRIQVRIVHIRQ